MRKVRLSQSEKLIQRCHALAEVIQKMRGIYRTQSITSTQKDLLETLIGAGVWYLPECKGLYTGRISEAALKERRRSGKYAGLTKEHFFPRKRAGKYLLSRNVEGLTAESFLKLYRKKFGRYNYVTKEENRRLMSYQRRHRNTEKCYKDAGIELVQDPTRMKGSTRLKN